MTGANKLLIDTDVLIDYLRGKAEAVAFIDGLADPFAASVVTVAELFAGVREGAERSQLEAFVSAIDVIEIDAAIAEQGGLFRRDFRKSHATGLADALIAATAELRGLTLITLNTKHFPMLSSATAPY